MDNVEGGKMYTSSKIEKAEWERDRERGGERDREGGEGGGRIEHWPYGLSTCLCKDDQGFLRILCTEREGHLEQLKLKTLPP
jgi:hypothetical protein